MFYPCVILILLVCAQGRGLLPRPLTHSESPLSLAADRFSYLEGPQFEPPLLPFRLLSPKLRALIHSFFCEESSEVSGRLRLLILSPFLFASSSCPWSLAPIEARLMRMAGLVGLLATPMCLVDSVAPPFCLKLLSVALASSAIRFTCLPICRSL